MIYSQKLVQNEHSNEGRYLGLATPNVGQCYRTSDTDSVCSHAALDLTGSLRLLWCMARRNGHDESLSVVRIAVRSTHMGKGWNYLTEGHVFGCSTYSRALLRSEQGKNMFSQPWSTSESGQGCAPCQTTDHVHQPCLPLCLNVWVCTRLTPPSCTLRMME